MGTILLLAPAAGARPWRQQVKEAASLSIDKGDGSAALNVEQRRPREQRLQNRSAYQLAAIDP
ncbi:hypothetical protein FQV39_23445 [Bosea sp. F3-2]|uniref:hypothetical protein n=1 Tax=Bosea sp. F3-2 TaxID=2599640 RepID=UPI0011EF6A25|nr:hypothetical protein [Bosea sp. F3-2]QEL25222.1 hypothetical protein FQV39_23445 [Bosea sp. F3-2]